MGQPEGVMLNAMQRKALEYVRNTNGGATLRHFMEDHEPIGDQLWAALKYPVELAVVDPQTGRLRVTDAGNEDSAVNDDEAVREQAMMNLLSGLSAKERRVQAPRLLDELARIHAEAGVPIPAWIEALRQRFRPP